MKGRTCTWIAAAMVGLAACGSSSQPATVECGATSGVTVEHEVEALDSRAGSVLIHLPPCYDDNEARYPVVYLMHGAGMTAASWIAHPIRADQVIDELVGSGTVAPVIVVMPNGASGRARFTDGEFDQVLASIDDAFRTIDDARSRAVAGVSAGGPTAALVAADTEATEFAALGLFMTVWGSSLDERFRAGMRDGDSVPAVLVDIGERDGLRSHNDTMAATFAAVGIDASFEVHPGGHDFAFVAGRFPDWIRWLIERVTLGV